MTTYTVYNLEEEFGRDEWQGLTLSGAVGLLMQKTRSSCTIRRNADGVMCMEIYPDIGVDEHLLQSSNPDDEAALQEIFERFAAGELWVGGPYILTTDEKYERERQRYLLSEAECTTMQ